VFVEVHVSTTIIWIDVAGMVEEIYFFQNYKRLLRWDELGSWE
jgi:hypothetical protein